MISYVRSGQPNLNMLIFIAKCAFWTKAQSCLNYRMGNAYVKNGLTDFQRMRPKEFGLPWCFSFTWP